MMAGSGRRGNDSEAAADRNPSFDAQAETGRVGGRQEEPDANTRRFPRSRVSRAERDRMVKEARAITFPVTVRGYERAAVDRYVQQVNRLIAELEISSSSESAVRHALAEVTEETREILQRAHETADELVKAADIRARELGDNADHIWRERRRLIEDLRVVGEQLLAIGEAESKRFARPTENADSLTEHSREPIAPAAELAAALQE